MRHPAAISAILILVGACSNRETSIERKVTGTGMVETVSYSRLDGLPSINVWSVTGTQVHDLADLSLFEDFAPCMTFDDVARRYGTADASQTLPNQTEIRTYRKGTANVGVAHEFWFSGSPPTEAWSVWAFPVEGGFELRSLVRSNVFSQLQAPPSPYNLVLRDATKAEESV